MTMNTLDQIKPIITGINLGTPGGDRCVITVTQNQYECGFFMSRLRDMYPNVEFRVEQK
jgi:hypothetical protein